MNTRQNRRDSAELRALIEMSGLTQGQAAERLGVTRRSMTNYLDPEQPVPPYILLAMRWVAHESLTAVTT